MNIEELKRLAFDSKAWYDAGAVINDPYDTHPNELFDAAVDETVVLDLISQIEQLRAGVNTCGAGAGCCAQAAEIERLKAELGDLPEAQADMLRTIKELRAEAELFAKHVGIKLARKDALLRECLAVLSASYAEHYDEALELRLEASIKTELGEQA